MAKGVLKTDGVLHLNQYRRRQSTKKPSKTIFRYIT